MKNLNIDIIKDFGWKRGLGLIRPPRYGGTTTSLKLGLQLGKTVYLNYRHVNHQHAIEVISKIAKENYEIYIVTHIIGRDRINEFDYEVSKDNIVAFTPRFAKLLALQRLKEENVERVDPYNILLQQAKNSDVVLTVPQIAWREFDPSEFDVLVIDESPTIEIFMPESVCIFKVPWNLTEKGNLDEITKKFFRRFIDNCPSYIKENHPLYIKWCEEVQNILSDFWNIYKEKKANGAEHTIVEALDEIIARLPGPPYINDPLPVRIAIAEDILRHTYSEEEYETVKLFIACLFFKSYYRDTHKKTEKDIYIVPERVLLFKDWLKAFKHIIVRCNDRKTAEEFFEALGFVEDEDYIIDEVNEFKYARNFILVSSDLKEVAKQLHEQKIPFLVLCGTKKEAEEAYEWFSKNGFYGKVLLADAYTSPQNIVEAYNKGNIVIFYQNSSISRGVDLPFYQVVLVWSFSFACPYEELISSDEALRKIANELEQSILRISPIPGFDEDSIKIVVFDDERSLLKVIKHLKYVGHRYIGKVDPEFIAKIGGLFLRYFVEEKAESESHDKNALPPVSFYGLTIDKKTIYLDVQTKSYDIGAFLLKAALLDENSNTAKTTARFSLTPDDFRNWFEAIAGQKFAKIADLRAKLKDVDGRFSDVVLQKMFVRVLKKTKLVKETDDGVIVAEKSVGFLERRKMLVGVTISYPDGDVILHELDTFRINDLNIGENAGMLERIVDGCGECDSGAVGVS